jgi:serine phosphatase RsbU (regulator of sigma subunit)
MIPAYLETEENGQLRIHLIAKDVFTIGRWADRDLGFNFMDVSRDHAVIESRGDRFLIRDSGSSFGTFVNGERVTECALLDGDSVRIGPSEAMQFVFRLGMPAGETPTVPIQPPAAGLHQITLLLQGLRAMGSGRVLEEVLAIVIDSAVELAVAERGFVLFPNAAGELEVSVGRRRNKQDIEDKEVVLSRKTYEAVFAEGRTIVEADLFEVRNRKGPTVEAEIRSAICIPLRLAQRPGSRQTGTMRTIGVLYLDSRDRAGFLSQAVLAALEALSDEAALAIQNAQLLRIEQDLRAAAKVQADLLPPRSHLSAPIEVAGHMVASRFVGGDFFDYFETEDGTLVFAEGDVSGKGLPAALLAARTQGIFSTAAPLTGGPAELMTHVNRMLSRRPLNGFVTMACATLDAQGRLVTCNAGHNPPLVVRKDGTIEPLEAGGLPLALFDMSYEQQSLTLAPGEFAILYSDGVTECADGHGEFFGEERVRACLEHCCGMGAGGVLERIFHSVSEFSGKALQADDITVLVVRYLGPPES